MNAIGTAVRPHRPRRLQRLEVLQSLGTSAGAIVDKRNDEHWKFMRVLTLLMLGLCATWSAFGSDLAGACSPWKKGARDPTDVAEMISRPGAVPSRLSEQSLRCLEELWKRRDAAVGGDVSRVLLYRLAENPSAFLRRYARAPTVYEEWLSQIENFGFSSIEDPPTAVAEMKREAIEALQRTRPMATAEKRAKDNLIRKLQAARIRVID